MKALLAGLAVAVLLVSAAQADTQERHRPRDGKKAQVVHRDDSMFPVKH